MAVLACSEALVICNNRDIVITGTINGAEKEETIAIATLLQVLNYAYSFEKTEEGGWKRSHKLPLNRATGIYFAQSCIALTPTEAVCLMWSNESDVANIGLIEDAFPLLAVTALAVDIAKEKTLDQCKKRFPHLNIENADS